MIMIEKVNPAHPDKIADRISGAMLDIAYENQDNPKVAIEVLIGHGVCQIIAESSYEFKQHEVEEIVKRIAKEDISVTLLCVPQDINLANNQKNEIKCGDNGIFKGVPLTEEQKRISKVAREIYKNYPTDGKYILNDDQLIICQSCAKTEDLNKLYATATINPLGEWTGGVNVDSGCTNRKLGSDMADSVTGGGVNGKDLSKADVSINIYAFLKAQKLNKPVEFCCAIGDKYIDNKSYGEIVEIAKAFVAQCGGFEKFSEWGLF